MSPMHVSRAVFSAPFPCTRTIGLLIPLIPLQTSRSLTLRRFAGLFACVQLPCAIVAALMYLKIQKLEDETEVTCVNSLRLETA